MFTVCVDHASLEPGMIGEDKREAYRETFTTALAAAYGLLAQIEGGRNAPARRHGFYYILERGNQWPLDPFCAEHRIRLPKSR